MGSLAPVPPGKPYPPQGPTLMKSRDFRKIQIFNFSWKPGGPDSHERSRSIPSLLTLFGCASGSHCSPIPHQPLLLGPWRQWSLQPPPWRLAPYSGGCSVWPLILQMKEVRPKWSETSLIGGRGDHRAPPVTRIPNPGCSLLFTTLFYLPKMCQPWLVSGRLNAASKGSTLPVKLGRTSLWDGHTISKGPKLSNNS